MQEILIQNKEFILILHLLSVVFGMGGALMTDILFVYFAFNKKLSNSEIKVIHILSKVVLYALIFIIITGIFIFFTNPEKYLNSAKFLTKMTVVSILSINGFLLHNLIFKHLKEKDYLTKIQNKKSRRLAFVFGAISLVSWLSALSLGSLDKIAISYFEALMIYFTILILGIIFSQIIFKFYENKSKISFSSKRFQN
jgi:hypothetical protein